MKRYNYNRYLRRRKKFYNKPIVEESFNVDLAFIDFIIPRLELFEEEASKHIKYDFDLVREIIKGFRLYQNKFEWETEDVQDNFKQVQRSMELFAAHFHEFWW